MDTVLVLEDEPIALRTIRAVLRSRRYNVLEATTAAEALHVGRDLATPLDLLIADFLLPEQTGVEVAVQLFEVRPQIAILFISGTPLEGWPSRDRLTLHVLPRKIWEFLQKPFPASALEHYVQKLLWRPAPAVSAAAASGGERETLPPQPPQATPDAAEMILPDLPGTGLSIPLSPASAPHIPDIAFCEEKVKLSDEFLRAIHELTALHAQQTRAVLQQDPDYSRFDLLIHLAVARKDEAKQALIRHIESHGCAES